MGRVLKPARVPPPGRILSQELESRGWSQGDLAAVMGRPQQVISEIVNAKKQITPQTALELAQAFGTSAEFWTDLETNYQLHRVRSRGGDDAIARRRRLYELAPVRELSKRGWIDDVDVLDDLEREVCVFLGIASPDETPKAFAQFRRGRQRDPVIAAQVSWLARVESLARQHDLGAARCQADQTVPGLLALTEHLQGVQGVSAHLQRCGIRFLIVPHLSKTYIDGAAFRLDGRDPVVAVTLRYDRIDNFWFTLLHEVAHIVLGHGDVFADQVHDQDSAALASAERSATSHARDWLIPPEAFAAFVAEADFTRSSIRRFAATVRRHPGIIVGRLQNEGHLTYRQHRPYLDKVGGLLAATIDTAGPAIGAE